MAGAPSPPAPRFIAPSSPAVVLFEEVVDNDDGKETFVAATNVKYSPAPMSCLPLLLLLLSSLIDSSGYNDFRSNGPS